MTPMLAATSLRVWRESATSTSLRRRRPARFSQVVTTMLTASVPNMTTKEAVPTTVGALCPDKWSMAPRPTV